jgi:DNA modification methylase
VSYLLLRGDARRLPIADGSVHAVVTSPPYWGLRDYGIPPSVWGGESSCHHEWGPDVRAAWANDVPGPSDNVPKNAACRSRPKEVGPFCVRCSAWRGCFGLEPTPEMYVEHSVAIFREVWRVLRDDGTLWLNLGDTYATGAGKVGDCPGGGDQGERWKGGRGSHDQTFRRDRKPVGPTIQPNRMPLPGLKPKDLVGIPWRVALALQADGWTLRSDIIWAKTNPMPESVIDRPTKAHEYLFLLTKAERYFYDADAIREPITSSGGACFGPQKKTKVPSGWDTGGGAHGNFHRNGRGAPEYREMGVQSRALEDPAERNHPLGRNKRSVWPIPVSAFPGAHFATFPPDLVRPCILAGTSPVACGACAAPWVRSTEVRYENPGNRTTNGPRSIERKHKEYGTAGFGVRMERRAFTVGWEPSCDHRDDSGRCIVLDPFAGAGTTALVAAMLGRRFVGTELNRDYAVMATRRVADGLRPVSRLDGPRPPAPLPGQMELFG